MPYYKSIWEESMPSSRAGLSYQLQTRMFCEEVGFRSRPKSGAVSTLLPGKTAEPYSWLDANNNIKAQVFKSAHPELASSFKKDKGHNWDFRSLENHGKPWSFSTWRNGSTTIVENVYPSSGSFTGAIDPYSSDLSAGNDLSSYAALEYGRTAPTNDQFSMSAFIGELREGLPALIPALLVTGNKAAFKSTLKKQTKRLHDAGSDYLNVQFGWIPLLSDVRKIATALAVATVAISGDSLSTHRRREKPGVEFVNSGKPTNLAYFNRIISADLGSNTGSLTGVSNLLHSIWVSQTKTVDYSFEAEFLRLPEAQVDFGPYLNKLNELMRWDITPSDLWQLAPWSWLVDWFFDIGGQLESWQSATSNRILSLYAYGMRDERRSTTTIVSDIRGVTGVDYIGPKSIYYRSDYRRRQRLKANPFGYILNPLNQLSAGQLAILGALGLTKTRR